MGIGDKFKNLAKQAQDAVVEHKDQIHEAVDGVGVAADRRTRGRYSAKIAKMGEKAGNAVDRLGGDEAEPGTEKAGAGDASGPAAAVQPDAPKAAPSVDDATKAGSPKTNL